MMKRQNVVLILFGLVFLAQINWPFHCLKKGEGDLKSKETLSDLAECGLEVYRYAKQTG